jgi:pimeloyl-ACP methyl ester carboxylesterase
VTLRTRTGALVLIATVANSVPAVALAQETQLVDAGGHQLEMILKGQGAPTVVFDAGMGGGMRGWNRARDSVSVHASTVLFERAGFGESEVGPSPRTARQLSTELRAALVNAGVEFPIVLVGHSAGGLFSVVFASTYPNDVAGLVLVDPATDFAYDRWRDEDPTGWASRTTPPGGFEPPPGWPGQIEALPESIQQFRSSFPLPEIPVIVLTALTPVGGPPLRVGAAEWEQDHLALLARMPRAEHIVLPDAHHGSILGEAVLWEKILEVLSGVAGR